MTNFNIIFFAKAYYAITTIIGLVINTLETLLFFANFLNSSILPKMGTPKIILPLNEGLSSNIPTGYNSSFELLSNIFLKLIVKAFLHQLKLFSHHFYLVEQNL